jgi:hypothetical protein
MHVRIRILCLFTREMYRSHDALMSSFPVAVYVLGHRVAISFHVIKIKLTDKVQLYLKRM